VTRLFTGVGALLAVLGLLWLMLHTLTSDPAPAEILTEQQPRYYVLGAEWTRLDAEGRPETRVTADLIEYFDDDSARLETLVVDQMGGTGSPWRLTSPSGYAPPYERRLRLDGPVQGEGRWPEGDRLEFMTDHLWVDSQAREFYTEAGVEVRGPGRNLTARGLRADWDGERLQLLHEVRLNHALPD
jgi:LPS export ABC transporter protein LptC